MRIAANVGTEAIGASTAPGDIVGQVLAAEAAGFPSAWSVHFSRGVDALTVLGVAGARTQRMDLGVAVVPTYPRHPIALAQQAATVQALVGGRLTLGVGVSHRPVIEGMHGLSYAQPAEHMREYLSVLGPLLDGGAVTFEGSLFRVEAQITVPATQRVQVVVGGLSPRMVQLGGELADGLATWLAGPRTLESEIVPGVRRAAADAGRPPPRVVAGLPVAVHDDVDVARAAAREVFGRYAALPNYQRQLARDGAATPGEVAVVGGEATVEQELQALANTGVTELWPVAFPVGDDPEASLRRTAQLLSSLAPELGAGP